MESKMQIDENVLESLRNEVVVDENSYKNALKKLKDAFKNDANLKYVLERGLCLSKKYKSNVDLLWMGFNPSYDETKQTVKQEPRPLEFAEPYDPFDELLRTGHGYWVTVRRRLLGENQQENNNVNKEHLDLFSIRNTRQEFINLVGKRNANSDTMEFFKCHIWYSQQFMEHYLKPKVIILANKAAGAYLGLDQRYVWMGYKTTEIKELPPGKVYRIDGIRDEAGLIRQKSSYNNELNETVILHARFQGNGCPTEQQIRPEHIDMLLKMFGK